MFSSGGGGIEKKGNFLTGKGGLSDEKTRRNRTIINVECTGTKYKKNQESRRGEFFRVKKAPTTKELNLISMPCHVEGLVFFNKGGNIN